MGGVQSGLASQTLLGVTGSGKTFAIANVIAAVQRPTPRAGAEQDARGAALRRVPRVLSAQCGGVLRLLLRLLPAGSLRSLFGHLHREGRLGERAHRADAPLRHQGAAGTAGYGDRGLGVGHLRPRRSAVLPAHGAAPRPWRPRGPALRAAPLGRTAIHAQPTWRPARHLPRARRRDRRLPRRIGEGRRARGALRRRDRQHLHLRPRSPARS